MIQVQDFGGTSELRRFLRAFQSASNYDQVTSLGIVRDAENDPEGAFRSVCDALQYAGLAVPANPILPTGIKPRTSVLILPGGTRVGNLESLCLQAVAADPAMACVDAFLQCVENLSGPWAGMMREKARLRALLASRRRPHLLLGYALDEGYLPWESPAFDPIKQYLTDL
jgi:hypothetical protein